MLVRFCCASVTRSSYFGRVPQSCALPAALTSACLEPPPFLTSNAASSCPIMPALTANSQHSPSRHALCPKSLTLSSDFQNRCFNRYRCSGTAAQQVDLIHHCCLATGPHRGSSRLIEERGDLLAARIAFTFTWYPQSTLCCATSGHFGIPSCL